MLKAIFAKHVKTEDSILLSGGERITVNGVRQYGPSPVFLETDKGSRSLHEYDLVGLGHRPLPEGKTEEAMLDAVERAMRACATATIEIDAHSTGAYLDLRRGSVGLDDNLRLLREAIEAYELGKLPEVKP